MQWFEVPSELLLFFSPAIVATISFGMYYCWKKITADLEKTWDFYHFLVIAIMECSQSFLSALVLYILASWKIIDNALLGISFLFAAITFCINRLTTPFFEFSHPIIFIDPIISLAFSSGSEVAVKVTICTVGCLLLLLLLLRAYFLNSDVMRARAIPDNDKGDIIGVSEITIRVTGPDDNGDSLQMSGIQTPDVENAITEDDLQWEIDSAVTGPDDQGHI
ncbi:hypothetical protein V6N13_077982 [Hibiscus sabdariffa]